MKRPRRRFRPELGKKKKLQRLGGLEGVLGSALGSQECGESGGRLNLVREVLSTTNLKGKGVGFLSVMDSKQTTSPTSMLRKEKGARL